MSPRARLFHRRPFNVSASDAGARHIRNDSGGLRGTVAFVIECMYTPCMHDVKTTEERSSSLEQLLTFSGVDNIPDGRQASATPDLLKLAGALTLGSCSYAPPVNLHVTALDVRWMLN